MGLFKKEKTELTEEDRKIKFYKKIKVKKNTKEEDIQKKIVKFVSKGIKLDSIYLTEKQQLDPIFMLSLYKTNPKVYKFFKPVKKLQENAFYMKTCINCLVDRTCRSDKEIRSKLINLLMGLDSAFNDVRFVRMLIDSYPSQDMIGILFEALVNEKTGIIKDQQNYKTFIKILDELPRDYYEILIKHNGVDAIYLLPESHKYYRDLASLAVRKQGFTAIRALRPQFILENIDLLVYATKNSHVNELYQYLRFDLTKEKAECKSKIDELKEIKHKIINNPKIRELLNNEFYVTNHMLDSLENI